MRKTVEAVVTPTLRERWWWRWRWVFFLLLLLVYWLSSGLFPDWPLREGYIGLFRGIAAGLFFFLIGCFAIRSAYWNTKSKVDKLGCLFSLFRWWLALKLFAIGSFMLFIFAKDVFMEQQILEVVEYRIDRHEMIDNCTDQHFNINRGTLEKLIAEQPPALHITYWSSGVVGTVQFLTQEQAGQIVTSCHLSQ